MNLIKCGKIVGTHGVRGEIKIQPWCDGPEFLMEFNRLYFEDGSELIFVSKRLHKQNIIAVVEGVADIDAATELINRTLFLDRDEVELEEGAYFIEDLLKLQVRNAASGEILGRMNDVLQTGGRDVYSFKTPDGKTMLFPAVPEIIKNVDLERGFIDIEPLEGLFD